MKFTLFVVLSCLSVSYVNALYLKTWGNTNATALGTERIVLDKISTFKKVKHSFTYPKVKSKQIFNFFPRRFFEHWPNNSVICIIWIIDNVSQTLLLCPNLGHIEIPYRWNRTHRHGNTQYRRGYQRFAWKSSQSWFNITSWPWNRFNLYFLHAKKVIEFFLEIGGEYFYYGQISSSSEIEKKWRTMIINCQMKTNQSRNQLCFHSFFKFILSENEQKSPIKLLAKLLQ